MTMDTEEFSQFTESVACREYTLPRDEKSSDPKGWIRGNTKIGPVLEVTTSYQQGKFGVEIGIEFINNDNSQSWVRISHGLNKLVTDLSNNKENDDNEQETSEMQFEDFALKTNVLASASRSKAEARPRRRTLAYSSTKTVPISVKKIESHPHREALQADLQQNNVYNPFSDDSKAMIREMANVELFELCETIPKVMLRMPSLLESRSDPLHLWTSLS